MEEVDFREAMVVHHEPVRIPVGALPQRPKFAGPAFSTTFVIGASAALWFAAALVTGAREPVIFASAWLAILVIDFRHNLKR